MYEQHWNLIQKPFDNSADRSWYYPAESHQGAMLKLRYAVESRHGAAILAGAAGLGKTLIINQLLGLLPESFQPVVNLVFPQMEADQLLALLVQELCGQAAPTTDQYVALLRRFLADNTAASRHAVVVIDEAHLLQDRRSIEMLRLLLNFQSAGQTDLTLICVGHPHLLTHFERLTGFEDRISVKCLLQPFSADETAGYISHRLTTARAERMIFTDAAMQSIHELSLGIPSRINRLCDLALLVGFAEERRQLDAPQVRAVSDELICVTRESQTA